MYVSSMIYELSVSPYALILTIRPDVDISTKAYKCGEVADHDIALGGVSSTSIGLSIRELQHAHGIIDCTPQCAQTSLQTPVSLLGVYLVLNH
jgi:hypothetical protein